MTDQSKRRSLLGGEILRRESSTLDQFLVKLVDAFDFQIADHAVDDKTLATAAVAQPQTHELRTRVKTCTSLVERCTSATTDARTPDVVLSPRAGAGSDPIGVKPTASAFFMHKLSEKLTEFVLNEPLDAVASAHSIELGSHKATARPMTRSSWFVDLRSRASMASEKDVESDGNDSDVYFQTDDESSGHHCSYQIMT